MLDKVVIHSKASSVVEAQEDIQALFEALKLASGADASTELIDERYELDADAADPVQRWYTGRGTIHFAGQQLTASEVHERVLMLAVAEG